MDTPTQMQAIYSSTTNDSTNEAANFEDWRVGITVDATPLSLSKVYALLTTLNMIPVSAKSTLTRDQVIEIEFLFANINSIMADRLYRKVSQLTETILWKSS
jgi:hypothetical protein